MGLGTANAGIDPGIDPGTGVDQTFPASSPSPTITSISPPSAIAGGGAFLLEIAGSYFTSDTQVSFGTDGPITPVIVGGTLLLVPVQAADIASAGTIEVAVTNGGGSASESFLVISRVLFGPLTATTTPSPVVVRAGDTSPAFTALLADANGPVDVSADTLTMLVRYAGSTDNIAGGTAEATATKGEVACNLPVFGYDGFFYAYITDGNGASYPDSGPGFLIVVAPAIVTS